MEGVSQWDAPEVRIFTQIWGWQLVVSALSLFLMTRVAGRAFARMQLWLSVGFLCITASSTAVTRTNPANGLLPVGWTEAVAWTIVLAASLMSLHYDSGDHHPAQPTSPRRGPRKRSH